MRLNPQPPLSRLPHQGYARLTAEGAHLVLTSSYHQAFVAELRQAVPAGARKWERERRAWLVDPAYGDTVARLCELYLGVKPSVPAVSPAAAVAPQSVVRLLVVEYLGGARLRPGGQVTAMGWVDGEWRVAFDVAVLRRFFEPGYGVGDALDEAVAGAPPTLYALLGVTPQASGDELKAAFRRQALHLHPDRNREQDAAERFRQAKEAYDLLRDPLARRKYDVGLAFEADVHRYEALDRRRRQRWEQTLPDHTVYRAPVTNGVFLLRGTPRLGVFVAAEVLQREDIVSRDGAVLVSSWPKDGETFERRWVRPEAVAVP